MTTNYDLAEKARAELPLMADAVARELGEGWKRVSGAVRSDGVKLEGPDGERLALYVDSSRPERVVIDGWLPHEIHEAGADTYGLRTPDISVALSRGARVISREIIRRLLPRYRAILAEARKRAADSRQGQADRDEAVQVAAELLRVPVPEPRRHGNVNDSVTVSRFHRGLGSTRVEVRTGGTVRIETNGTIDQMRDVLAALGQIPA
ncbi:hypothetical protein ACFOOK_26400 [Micromonospora krabiensis]|uniref:Uncharacterized protein n=1 Tax=Micromonospora krabiensis TaxID=307121 RepID=A0A1C3N5Q4_9ACTN|nr:hypothetical protein [Micromonospora krabiensis]SBV27901.1 hypothetical protein GA0070620_3432 [Micromonospora krabiensis]